ncbi:MAG TPA: redoxin domain-containing protein [Polyangiaceae bacterium]|nr:redoxin domain-containing protein [Polyangiaceae bacterium]
MLIQRRPLITGLGLTLVSVGCGDGDRTLNEPGAPAPSFALEDFQPKSARFGESYGSEEFKGAVLLLPLFAAWCPTCVGCAVLLDGLYQEWRADGLNVRIMSINSIDGRSSRQKLVDACSFPLLQDTKEATVWDTLRGTKDDHYIYTPESVLDRYYDYEAGQRVDPISVAGKASLREALVAAGA